MKTIDHLVLEQARATPEAIAVEHGDVSLDYSGLVARAARVSAALRSAGVGRGDVVGVCMERGVDLVCALLGVLRAGAAYVPLDPGYPASRLRTIVEDAGAAVVLVDGAGATLRLPSRTELRIADAIATAPGTDEVTARAPADLAYLIYTSGTTGVPKGVMVEHAQLSNFVLAMRHGLALERGLRLLALTPISFDISVLELFVPLVLGGTVVIADREVARDPARLAETIGSREIDVVQATPTTWRMLVERGWRPDPPLTMLVGGEAFPAEIADTLLGPGNRVWNLYGPTETTVWSAAYPVERAAANQPIGRPIANTRLYVLSAAMERLPVGAVGELFIGGRGVARGYRDRPALTAERFVPDPFGTMPGARLYRSGDLARITREGLVECLGRRDDQVKVRGHRLELGEVDAAIASCPGVSAGAAATWPDGAGGLRLAGFYTGVANAADVRAALRERLPSQAVPDLVRKLATMPVTPSGKIDRKALASLAATDADPEGVEARAGAAERPATLTRVETEVARIWEEVLGVAVHRADADFFALGGNSLLAARIGARIRASLDARLDLKALFDGRTLGACARAVEAAFGSAGPVARRHSPGEPFPILPAQESLLFLARLGEADRAYHGRIALEIEGAIDADALARAWDRLVRRHQALRTRFVASGDSFHQELCDRPEAPFVAHRRGEPDGRGRAPTLDVFAGGLFRGDWFEGEDGRSTLVVSFHHVVLDAWSLGIIARDLSAFYDLERGASRDEPPPPAIGYPDAALWLDGGDADTRTGDLAFWKATLDGLSDGLDLPTDFPRPAVATFRGGSVPLSISADLLQRVRTLAASQGASTFTVLASALVLTLSKLTGSRDVCLGTPVAGRDHPDLEGVVGYFLDTVAIRSRWEGDPRFSDLLALVRGAALDAFAHRRTPFHHVVRELGLVPDLSRHPVFQVMLLLNNVGLEELRLGDARLHYREEPRTGSKFDLTLNLTETSEGLIGLVEYAADLFLPETAAWLSRLFVSTLEAAVTRPEARLSELRPDLGFPAHGTRISTSLQVTGTQTVVSRFLDVAARRASRRAVVGPDGDAWTYGELRDAADRIRTALIEQGLGPGDRVALLLEHDRALPAAILGALWAGAVYVPLDPAHPDARLAAVARHAGAALVLASGSLAARATAIAGLTAPVVSLETALACEASSVRVDPRRPDSVTYILYTSGTTGSPKGVFQNDRNVLHHAIGYAASIGLGEEDSVSLLASYAFDAAVMDLFGALLTGAELSLYDLRRDGLAPIGDWLARDRVSVLHVTPTVFRAIAETLDGEPIESVRVVVLGGEEARSDDIERLRRHFRPDCRLVNGLGPTESTLALQMHLDARSAVAAARIPVGFPVPGTEIRLLDEAGAENAFVGEIEICSPHVALGYWGDPEGTARGFGVRADGRRTYRTGDLARRLPDGAYEFLGRRDRQAKVNGVRVELAEVERALVACPGVGQARVVQRAGRSALTAYVAPERRRSASRPIGRGAGAPALSILFFADGRSGDGDARYGLYLEAARRADALGLHAVWTPERHFTEVADAFPNPSVLNAALATVTERIGLRAGSVVLPLHHPLRVAEEWAVVDNLSSGRVGVSFAPGWVPDDFVFAPDDYGRRHETMLRLADEVRRLWRGEAVRYRSGTGAERDYRTSPRPVQPDLPVWLTVSRNPAMFAEAGRAGANVLTSVQNQTYRQLSENIAAYRTARAEAGHDPDAGIITLMMHCFVAPSDAHARATARPALRRYIGAHTALRRQVVETLGMTLEVDGDDDLDRLIDLSVDRYVGELAFIGSPATLTTRATELFEMGVDEIAGLIDFGIDDETLLSSLSELGVLADACRAGSTPLALAARLRETLPAAMVPADIVVLGALPTNANGKIDERALPEPDPGPVSRAAPADAIEERLVAVFSRVLGRDAVGVEDSFFSLGGHSLLAMRLVRSLRDELGHEISLRTVFERPSPRALANWLRAAAPVAARDEVEPAPRGQPLPLSFGQERLWLLDTLGETPAVYHVALFLRLEGALDADALEAAFHGLAQRHEILRQRLVTLEGEDFPRQVFTPEPDVPLVRVGVADETDARGLAALVIARRFDFEREPPLRVVLMQAADGCAYLLVVMHHIVSDAWSTAIMAEELPRLYARALGEPATLPTLPLQCADFAVAERAFLDSERAQAQLGYWSRSLAGADFAPEFPLDRPRPPAASGNGAHYSLRLPKRTTARVRALAAQTGSTTFAVVLAALQVVLARWSGLRDFCIGTPVAGRHRAGSEKLVGYFANTLPLRARLSETATFAEVIDAARAASVDALDNQDVPFERIVDAVGGYGDPSRHPLFQVAFTLDTPRLTELSLPGIVARRLPLWTATSKFDMAFLLGEHDDAIVGVVEYATDIYAESTVARVADELRRLLDDLDPDARVLDARLPAPQAPRADRGAQAAEPRIEERVRAVAEATPDAVAIVSDAGETSFRELTTRARAVAGALIAAGVEPGDVVGLAMRRSADVVVAMLATLEAGASYLPLDPDYPRERLRLMLEDARAKLVVADEDASDLDIEGRTLLFPGLADAVVGPLPDAGPKGGAEATAYVMFTSGSTGRPKAVLVPHRAVTSLAADAEVLRLGSSDTVAVAAPLGFDASTIEIWGGLLNGGRLALLPPGPFDPDALRKFLADAKVTVLWLTAGLLREFLRDGAAGFEGLRLLISGGDVFPTSGLAAFMAALPGVTFANGYGPTECTTFASMHAFDAAPDGAIPIGRAVGGRTVQLLDEAMRPTPLGEIGEVCIGGAGLAHGYASQPGMTASRFVPDPSGPPGARVYRTGDLARRREDGVLEFVGRMDDQVKIRGYRVEPGEIEAALADAGWGDRCALAVRRSSAGEASLALFVEARDASGAVFAVREALRARLPAFMMPDVVEAVPAFPLDPNGKIDRRALLERSRGPASGERDGDDPLRRALAEIWTDLLGVASVGDDADFFDLGGHSLLAMRLATQVRARLGCEVPVRLIFEARRLAPYCDRLRALKARAGSESLPPLHSRPEWASTRAPLSFGQDRLWTLQRLGAANEAYVVVVRLHWAGPIDIRVLTDAVHDLVRRHPVLASIIVDRGERWQETLPIDSVRVTVRETGGPGEDESGSHVFQLDREPPFRVTLTPCDDGWLLELVVHHIAIDGWSLDILLRELGAFYAARASGREAALSPLPVSYRDFAAWQRGWLSGPVLEEQLAYWRTRLAGAPGTLALPTDRPRPAVQDYSGASVPLALGPELSAAVRALALRENATVFMVLLAGLQALLARWSGQWDLCVGTPVANRRDARLEGLIGFFSNTVALRGRLAPGMRFVDHLRETRERVLEAFTHQDLPFERLVEDIRPERDPARHPLFQVMLAQRDVIAARSPAIEGVRITPRPPEATTTKFDLTLFVTDAGTQLTGRLEYATALFDRETVERLSEGLTALLGEAAARPEAPVGSLAVMPERERRRVVATFNATRDETIETAVRVDDLVLAQARRSPAATAVRCGTRSLAYAELEEAAQALAVRLSRAGVGRGAVVGVCLERCLELPAALLGILRAGAAYLPLDPELPPERLRFMARDAGCAAVVTTRALSGTAPEEAARLLLDEPESDPRAPRPADAGGGPLDPAYVIYTSGSTGRPKGVVVPHAGLANYLAWACRSYLEGAPHRAEGALLHGAFAFDMAVTSLFLPLLAGRTLSILPAGAALARLEDAAGPQGWPALLKLTPSHLAALAAHPAASDGTGPEILVVGGEALPAATVRQALARFPRARLVNEYGPTETVVGCAVFEARADAEDPVPIGRPIANMRLYVLDAGGEPCPVGVVGELHIAGVGLAQGYLGRPGQTAERFLPDPFGPPGGRLYRTGDLARWRRDGALDYLGRNDDQVKIRGHRIELGEVEAALAAAPGVRAAAVAARPDPAGATRLVGYLVGETGAAALDRDAVRDHLRTRLPPAMIPPILHPVDALPLTPNGKLDRNALPEPDDEPTHGAAAFEPPLGPVEDTLAAIWRDILQTDRIGRHDDFFARGGDSILALMIVSRAHAAGIALAPHMVFENPTIAALAQAAGDHETVSDAAIGEADENVPLAPVQRWFGALDLRHPDHWNLSLLLSPRRPVSPDAFTDAVEGLLARHPALTERYALGGATNTPCQGRRIELRRVTDEAALHRALADMHADLAPRAGRNLSACLFDLADGTQRIALVVHHLACDVVSLAILRDELEATLGDQERPQPSERVSFAESRRRLVRWAASDAGDREIAYWRARLPNVATRLPRDLVGSDNLNRDVAVVRFSLNEHQTTALRNLGGQHAQAVQVAALSRALGGWLGRDELVISMESHGRLGPFADLDLSRTVGWFTSIYPLVVDVTGGGDLLDRVLERLQELPAQGAGYAPARWLRPDGETIAFSSDVSFNYLGVLDGSGSGQGLLDALADPSPTRHRDDLRPFVLDVTTYVRHRRLTVVLGYCRNLHLPSTIERVGSSMQSALDALLRAPTRGGLPHEIAGLRDLIDTIERG
ncbi:amino acid adenylation domain-containing protein [Salinarimonas sp.]|uniref:amino acid adenylation domain-containing protein n=1 Tax=Salinarimonas sp. TaxID=2766526 RepID=UPI0032D91A4A